MSTFLNPVFKEEPTITPRFPCPRCRQIIALGAERCKYCDALIDATHAAALNAEYQKVTDAVASANTFKMSIPAAVLLTAICGVYLVTANLVSQRFLLLPFVVVSATVYAVNWFRKYGKIQTDDPDFPDALKAMRRALVVWCVTLILQVVLIGFVVANGRLHV